jgi:hypothetical protein
MNYSWYKNIQTSNKDLEGWENVSTLSSDGSVIEVSEPGWYYVDVSAILNRESKSDQSRVCKVTKMPELPTIETKEIVDDTDGLIKIDTQEGEEVDLVVTAKYNTGNAAKELYSDETSFEWRVKTQESSKFVPVEINENGPAIRVNKITDEDNNIVSTLTVKGISNTSMVYACFVTNTLNGKSVVSEEADTIKFFIY